MTELWTIDFRGFDTLMNALANLYPDVVAEEIYNTMELSLGAFHQAVVVETPVNTGVLRGSIATEITGTPVEMTGMVVTPLLYGWPVERGRMPGKMPPVEPIELWVIRKLGIQPPESENVAFLIARSIGRKGTKGAAMFHKGYEAALPHVRELWDGLPGRIIKRLT